MLKIKILPAVVLFVCVGLGGFMMGGLCLLYAMKNDSALAQGLPHLKSAQHAPAYAIPELSLARQTLADGLRKLYEWWPQPVDATLALDLSAGVSIPKAFRGRSLLS